MWRGEQGNARQQTLHEKQASTRGPLPVRRAIDDAPAGSRAATKRGLLDVPRLRAADRLMIAGMKLGFADAEARASTNS